MQCFLSIPPTSPCHHVNIHFFQSHLVVLKIKTEFHSTKLKMLWCYFLYLKKSSDKSYCDVVLLCPRSTFLPHLQPLPTWSNLTENMCNWLRKHTHTEKERKCATDINTRIHERKKEIYKRESEWVRERKRWGR